MTSKNENKLEVGDMFYHGLVKQWYYCYLDSDGDLELHLINGRDSGFSETEEWANEILKRDNTYKLVKGGGATMLQLYADALTKNVSAQ